MRTHRARAGAGNRLARDPLDVHGLPDLRVDADVLRPAPVGVDLSRAERVQGMAAGDDARGDDPERDLDAARVAVGRLPAPGLVQGPSADRECARVRRPARALA